MTKNDDALCRPTDLLLALSLLSRLPVPTLDTSRKGRAAWAYPLAGLVLGALAGLAGGLSILIGLPIALAAIVALSVLIVTTGAMHEDGLADTVDGLWGGWDRTRRLEIMKDSRIGAYGVIALVLCLLARWSAIAFLFNSGTSYAILALLAAAMLSRATMPFLMATLPHARRDGLSYEVGEVPALTVALGAGIAIVLSLVLVGGVTFWVVIWAGIGTAVLGMIARNKIGGQTGDILGASQQIAEITILFCLAASAT